jgi:hypothetical protein
MAAHSRKVGTPVKTPPYHLASHAIKTLPDSMANQKQLLKEITEHLPAGNELRVHSAYLLKLLTQHEQAQMEFALDHSVSRDGQGNGGGK